MFAGAGLVGPVSKVSNRPVPPDSRTRADARPAVRRPPALPLAATSGPLLQRCGAGPCDCAGQQEEGDIRRKPLKPGSARPSRVPPVVHEVLKSHGSPLSADIHAFFEPRFGQDFSVVRLHTDARAAASARTLGARGYTVGHDIVLSEDVSRAPTARDGELLAHELAHVVQQRGSVAARAELTVGEAHSAAEREADHAAEEVMRLPDRTHSLRPGDSRIAGIIQRACLSGSACVAPPGSSTQFGSDVQSREAPARARRAAMSPARQRVHGHTGHARALETFLNGQAPGLLGNIHGIFIDQDMDQGHVAASTQDCMSMIPPITGATKPCVFVPGALNQQAETFNTTPGASSIGGNSREGWRIDAVQTLEHEVQHVLYDKTESGTPVPPGVTSCTRSDIDGELSELNAIMSEFPTVFDAVPVGAPATEPAAIRLAESFNDKIGNTKEGIRGILTTCRCKCDCGDADKFVKETFDFVTSSWSAARKDAFNAELRKPARALSWPL
jgi:hypothetical protein